MLDRRVKNSPNIILKAHNLLKWKIVSQLLYCVAHHYQCVLANPFVREILSRGRAVLLI